MAVDKALKLLVVECRILVERRVVPVLSLRVIEGHRSPCRVGLLKSGEAMREAASESRIVAGGVEATLLAAL